MNIFAFNVDICFYFNILLNNSSLSGKVKADVLLLELDESYIKTLFNKTKLTHLVVTKSRFSFNLLSLTSC